MKALVQSSNVFARMARLMAPSGPRSRRLEVIVDAMERLIGEPVFQQRIGRPALHRLGVEGDQQRLLFAGEMNLFRLHPHLRSAARARAQYSLANAASFGWRGPCAEARYSAQWRFDAMNAQTSKSCSATSHRSTATTRSSAVSSRRSASTIATSPRSRRLPRKSARRRPACRSCSPAGPASARKPSCRP